jgi:hypothetical protein
MATKKEKNRADKEVIIAWMGTALAEPVLLEEFASLFQDSDVASGRVRVMAFLRQTAKERGQETVVNAMRLFDNSMQYADIIRRLIVDGVIPENRNQRSSICAGE